MREKRAVVNFLRKLSLLYTSAWILDLDSHFYRYFAAEIIGNMMDIEPRRWRRPKKVDSQFNKERVKKFKQRYDKFDWTGMIGK